MREVRVSDTTMKKFAESKDFSLSFKEKLEVSKLLDRMGASVIELEGIERVKTDSLLIKSIASIVKQAELAVPVALSAENLDVTWQALAEAKKPRLQVEASVSPAQIEYLYGKKADSMADAIEGAIAKCAALTKNVEFVAIDAGRSDMDYLANVISRAVAAGAATVTVCDTAGKMLPAEFSQFIRDLYAAAPELRQVCLGVSCSDDLSMADACAIASVIEGAGEIKAAAYPLNVASTERIAKILAAKQDVCQVSCSVRVTEISRITSQIARMCEAKQDKKTVFDAGSELAEGMVLTAHDDFEAVMACVAKLGYDLSPDDAASVYDAFLRIASKKDKVGGRELDAIVASAALQVPPTFMLDSYVINSGNVITATAHVTVTKNGEKTDSVALGDGPIDAAFMALEQIAGCRYELDDFQIQSVTEGQEAMGETVVKLASNGKVYSGRGISTDIVGASIAAYINALNKIVYEEQN